MYIGDTPEDVIGDDVWAETFTEQPAPLTAEEKKEYLSHVTGVCLGSDAFFPFGDNIERARRSGVTAIVQPGGSIRDQQVIDTCNKYGIAWPSAASGCSITKRKTGSPSQSKPVGFASSPKGGAFGSIPLVAAGVSASLGSPFGRAGAKRLRG